MKSLRGLVVDGGANEQVLVLLRGAVYDVIEVPGVGNAGGIDAVVQRAAKLRGAVQLVAEVGRGRGHMVLVVRQIVGGLQPTEGAQVIQLAACEIGRASWRERGSIS